MIEKCIYDSYGDLVYGVVKSIKETLEKKTDCLKRAAKSIEEYGQSVKSISGFEENKMYASVVDVLAAESFAIKTVETIKRCEERNIKGIWEKWSETCKKISSELSGTSFGESNSSFD